MEKWNLRKWKQESEPWHSLFVRFYTDLVQGVIKTLIEMAKIQQYNCPSSFHAHLDRVHVSTDLTQTRKILFRYRCAWRIGRSDIITHFYIGIFTKCVLPWAQIPEQLVASFNLKVLLALNQLFHHNATKNGTICTKSSLSRSTCVRIWNIP